MSPAGNVENLVTIQLSPRRRGQIQRHLNRRSWDVPPHPAFFFLSASILFNSSVKTSARPSFLRVNNMTSSVLILLRPACLAKDSRSTAVFSAVDGCQWTDDHLNIPPFIGNQAGWNNNDNNNDNNNNNNNNNNKKQQQRIFQDTSDGQYLVLLMAVQLCGDSPI